MEDLRITVVQSDLHWQNPQANLAMFEEKIWQIGQPTDLILLPEMFTTGFSMEAAHLAEPTGLTTFRWMQQQAAQTKAVVAGSYIVQEAGKYYNRLMAVFPDGTHAQYDKRHLFRLAGETEHYTAGKERLVLNIKGWRICPMICYDLRFPVWSRRHKDFQYDCLIYLANWPVPRVQAWATLLKARAIENQSYCVGVNRVGTDGIGLEYSGDSAVINYKGDELFTARYTNCLHTVQLEYASLQAFRERFPFDLDADDFEVMR
jgi:predicted amidohydrolase